MNLASARAELDDRGFSYLSASRMNLMLNRALVDFEDYWPWPWLRKTATGASPLAISDLKYVLSVRDATGTELLGYADTEPINMAEVGTPTGWWVDDSSGTATLRGWPVGAATLTVRYVKESSELVGDGDTPGIPSRYHPLWIDLAVIQAYKDSDNFAAAQALRQDTTASLQMLVERYETRDRQSSQQMLVRTVSEDE